MEEEQNGGRDFMNKDTQKLRRNREQMRRKNQRKNK